MDYEKLAGDRLGESSAQIREGAAKRPRSETEGMEKARERQRRRFGGTGLQCNGDMGPSEVRQHCGIDATGRSLLKAAMQQMQLSARAFHRILKLARTIADLAECDQIETPHLAEAIQYRPRRMV